MTDFTSKHGRSLTLALAKQAKVVKRSYKFRLYPTDAQQAKLQAQLAEAARLYNAALQERRDAWNVARRSVSFYDQQNQLKEIRANGDLAIPSFMVAQDVLMRVNRAFEGFFRRAKQGGRPGYPRFRSAARYDSLGTGRSGNGMYLRGDRVHIQGVGPVRFVQHRCIAGKAKTITIKREGSHWYVMVVVDCAPVALAATDSSIGVDVGLECFAALSDGSSVRAPQYLRKAEAKIRRAQRHLARCRRGSNRRKLAIARVQSAHVQVRNRRADFTHKLSRQIVDQHDHISVEKLNIRGLARTRMAKSIHDAGWRLFLGQLAYKAESAGRMFVEVNAAGTSQTCVCGASAPKRLRDRWHECSSCGLSAPRDVVSAQVIQQRGRRLQASTGPRGAVVCGGLL